MRIALGLMTCLIMLLCLSSARANATLHSAAAMFLVAQVETGPGSYAAGAVYRNTDTAEDEDAEALPPPPPRKLEGDIIRLKNGSVISGVQVIRVTPRAVVAQVHPNLDPLEIPRRQVESIEYDDKDPLRGDQTEGETAPPQPDIFIGEELAPEFYRKLTAPISQNPIIFQNIDFIALIADLAERTAVTIEISDEVREIPLEERIRSFEIPPNTSLLSFLQDSFLKSYAALRVLYPYDKAVVTTKAAAERNATHVAAPASSEANAFPVPPPAMP